MRQKIQEAYSKIQTAVDAGRKTVKESAFGEQCSIVQNRIKMTAAAECVKASPEKFEGLYEPVYRLIENPALPLSALREWNIRAGFLFADSRLEKLTKLCAESAWAKKNPQKAAKLMMQCIEKAGVTREQLDETNTLCLSPLQASAYRALDGQLLYAEQTVHVITAAWYCNGLVVEHGMTGEL